MAVRNYMLTEIQSRLFSICKQSLLQCFPIKYVNAHRSKITSGIRRLLLEIDNFAVLVRNHDAETFRLFHRHRHNGNRYFRSVLFMEIQHHFIIHLINMVARQNQNVFRIKAFHIIHILIDCIGSPRIPFAVRALLIRRQYRYTADIPVKIPRDTDSDMRIEPQRLVLGQYTNGINT